MVAIIRDKTTGEVAAVMDEQHTAAYNDKDPDKAGAGFAPAGNQEMIYLDETEEEFWEKARQNAGGEPAVAYAYDDGTVWADVDSGQPRTAVEAALLQIRAAVDERKQHSPDSSDAVQVEDVDLAMERERAQSEDR